jgi:sterol 14-demethylase
MKPTPPSIPGLPLIGNTLEFIRDRRSLLQRGFETFGPVFTVQLLNRKAVVLIGPEYQQLFFTETDKKLSLHKTYRYLKAAFGEVAFVVSPERYYQQRPIFQMSFKSERMPSHLKIMQDEVQQWLDSLGDKGEIELTEAVSTLVENITLHTFMGEDFRTQVGRQFWKYYPAIYKSLDPFFPNYLPLPKFFRRDMAKRRLLALLRPVIAERRAHPERYDDFLQDFATARYKDGSLVEDKTILGLLLGLMFAGIETTSAHMAWAIIQLLQHPDYLKVVQQECAEQLPGDQSIDARVLKSLSYTTYALHETTRMYPPADMIMRQAEEEIDLGDYRIPKGWGVIVTPALAHRLPTLFVEPDRYDPLRFAPDRREDHQHRFAMISFGGGIHKCAGMNFAHNEMTVILALLFQQFDVELVTKNPQIVQGLGVCPPEATLIRYMRKTRATMLQLEDAPLAQPTGCPYHHGEDISLAQPIDCPYRHGEDVLLAQAIPDAVESAPTRLIAPVSTGAGERDQSASTRFGSFPFSHINLQKAFLL